MKLSALALSCALAAVTHAASAQTPPRFPSKPVRIVVPYAAGGPVDDVARYIGQKVSPKWGQPVLVDTRGGSGGAVGAELVAKSPPDGYTLLLGNGGPMTVYPHLRKKPLYDPERAFEPVTWVLAAPMLLVVHPSTPIRSVRDLVRIAKQKPGGLTYASAGIGNLQHLSMELLQTMAGIKMVHVPYKGAAPAFVDLIAGQVDVMFANIVGALPQVKAGRLRAIAVSSAKPSAAAPGVAPIAQAYPGFDMTAWMGIFAPAGTPKELVAAIHRDLASVLVLPETRQRLAQQGADVIAQGPAELAAFMKKESAVFAKIINDAGIPQE
ncbi:MAG TPA: tripartite tricarboxylate transporter substrate binding protein [Burkholderiales bacterium]|nr:tripartite tricarboxylate transporter substrate binding protein [Burkholderiales bacterium]